MNTRYPLKEVLLILAVSLLPLFYLAVVYPSLPVTVATHFNAEGKPNGFGSKSTLWSVAALLCLIAAGLYLLLKNISSLDPKKATPSTQLIAGKIGMAVICLFSALNIMIVFAAVHNGLNIVHLLFPLLGLFFVFIGNLMHSLKPNYFIGIRLPWTLENENNWRATHRIGSKSFFTGGIFIVAATLLCPAGAVIFVFEGSVLIMTLVPVVYSFLYFRKHNP